MGCYLAFSIQPILPVMKKTVPLAILKAIEPILENLDRDIFVIDLQGRCVLRINDVDKTSDFFFEIEAYETGQNGQGKTVLQLAYCPEGESSVGIHQTRIYLDTLLAVYKAWEGVVTEYDRVKSVFDDHILGKYEKEFFAEFEVLEEDADKVGFDFQKQLLIDNALAGVIKTLESKKDETNKEQIEELIKEAEEIKEDLTELTKKETASRISKLFAKIRKGGMKLIKDTYPILQKEIIGQAVKGLIEFSSTHHLPDITSIL
jgi:hypothetical protein